MPNIERTVVYARDFAGDSYHGPGGATTQPLDLYPGRQLLHTPKQAEDAWPEISIGIAMKELLRLLLNMTKADDFGRYQAYLDGIILGGVIDLFSAKVGSEEVHLPDSWPEPGTHKLRLECVGKNA